MAREHARLTAQIARYSTIRSCALALLHGFANEILDEYAAHLPAPAENGTGPRQAPAEPSSAQPDTPDDELPPLTADDFEEAGWDDAEAIAQPHIFTAQQGRIVADTVGSEPPPNDDEADAGVEAESPEPAATLDAGEEYFDFPTVPDAAPDNGDDEFAGDRVEARQSEAPAPSSTKAMVEEPNAPSSEAQTTEASEDGGDELAEDPGGTSRGNALGEEGQTAAELETDDVDSITLALQELEAELSETGLRDNTFSDFESEAKDRDAAGADDALEDLYDDGEDFRGALDNSDMDPPSEPGPSDPEAPSASEEPRNSVEPEHDYLAEARHNVETFVADRMPGLLAEMSDAEAAMRLQEPGAPFRLLRALRRITHDFAQELYPPRDAHWLRLEQHYRKLDVEMYATLTQTQAQDLSTETFALLSDVLQIARRNRDLQA
jgi:hypothetical protein